MNDSYEMFLNHFSISKNDLYSWGINATIFVPFDMAAAEWNKLKTRVMNNQTVFIRGYGRDGQGTQLYKDFYKACLGNENIKKDPTNNHAPRQLIQRLTGKQINNNICNYQVSHIWGHTKNVFMFEAPWNICYTPKIMDPFTGHEAAGIWPKEYQAIFLAEAKKRFQPLIDDYNQMINSMNVEQQIHNYTHSLQGIITDKEIMQFERDITFELSSVF